MNTKAVRIIVHGQTNLDNRIHFTTAHRQVKSRGATSRIHKYLAKYLPRCFPPGCVIALEGRRRLKDFHRDGEGLIGDGGITLGIVI